MNKEKQKRMITERLKAWKEELKTNKHGWAKDAKAHIKYLKDELTRIENNGELL